MSEVEAVCTQSKEGGKAHLLHPKFPGHNSAKRLVPNNASVKWAERGTISASHGADEADFQMTGASLRTTSHHVEPHVSPALTACG
jgi:hypothetical protein